MDREAKRRNAYKQIGQGIPYALHALNTVTRQCNVQDWRRYSMLFSILRTAAKLRSSKMPIVSNKIVELADTPARKEDYIKTNGLRLVRRRAAKVL